MGSRGAADDPPSFGIRCRVTCFDCQTNFNPIDLIMAVRECDFVDAANDLIPLLPPDQGALRFT